MVIGTPAPRLDLIGVIATAPWSSPSRLPAPQGLGHWVFERPIATLLFFVAAAVVAILAGRARNRPRQARFVAACLLAAGAAVAALGWFVETDRERINRHSRELLDAVAIGDASAVGSLLSESIAIDLGAGSADLDRAWFLAGVELFPESAVVEAAAAPRERAVIDGSGVGRTHIHVLAGEPSGAKALTWWQLTWRRENDGIWRAFSVELILLNGKSPGAGLAGEIRSAVR